MRTLLAGFLIGAGVLGGLLASPVAAQPPGQVVDLGVYDNVFQSPQIAVPAGTTVSSTRSRTRVTTRTTATTIGGKCAAWCTCVKAADLGSAAADAKRLPQIVGSIEPARRFLRARRWDGL
jgi:hypothetical protein